MTSRSNRNGRGSGNGKRTGNKASSKKYKSVAGRKARRRTMKVQGRHARRRWLNKVRVAQSILQGANEALAYAKDQNKVEEGVQES